MSKLQQLRKGSMTRLILSVLEEEAKYGYKIMRSLSRLRAKAMTAALLYPALHRLEKQGDVKSEWQHVPGKGRRKYYTITDAGKRGLVDSTQESQTFFGKLFGLLNKQAILAQEGLS